MKKAFGLTVLLKMAKVKYVDNGKEIEFNLDEANRKVEELLKQFKVNFSRGINDKN